MTYSEFSIKMLREHLTTLAMKDRTPQKYSGPMFEAAEVISQLKRELADAEVEKQALRNAANGYKEALERLKAYEDTGMEPEEVKDHMNRWEYAAKIVGLIKQYGSRHLVDLIEAERDGRLVVLPCKVGDMLYVPGYKSENEPHIVKVHIRCLLDAVQYIDKIGGTVFLTREEAEAALEGDNNHA